MDDEREFTEAQLRWAIFITRNTNLDDDYVVRVARAGLGLFWAGEDEEEAADG